MNTGKRIALIAIYVALLIGGQLVLSGIAGVEIISALLVVFCFCFGVKSGVVTATVFSLLRCFLFGFFPSVIILYLVYFNLLAIIIGVIGNAFSRRLSWLSFVVILLVTAVLTACFTLLDDIISPIYYGFTKEATKAYFIASLPIMAVQVPISALTVGLLIFPLDKCFKIAKIV